MAFGTPVGVNDNRSLNTSDVVFDSFESVAGELLVMSVTLAGTGSQIPDSIVGHDGGKPWVQIGVTEQAGIRHSQSLWACHSSGATEVITVAYAVSQVMGCDLTRVTGADVSGTVENSFKDFKSNNGYATTVTTDALTDSDLTLGFYSIFSNRVLVTENTELLNYKYSYSQKSHATDYDVAGDLTPTCSIGAFATYSCQVCGIKAAPPTTVPRPLQLPKNVQNGFRLPNKLPLGDVEIDRSHPLASNIVAAVMVRGNGVELLHGVRSTVTGSPKKYKGGTWFSKAGLDSIKIPLPSNDMNWCEDSGITIAVATSYLSGSADYETAFEINNSANPTEERVTLGQGAYDPYGRLVLLAGRKYDAQANRHYTLNDTYTRSDIGENALVSVGSVDASSSVVATNGRLILDSPTTDIYAAGFSVDTLRIGTSQGTGSGQFEGGVYFGLVLDRSLTAEESVRLSGNIYDVLKPKTPQFYFVPSVAASTYDITAQETLTVTVPNAALVTGTGDLIGSPTFTIDVGVGGTTIEASSLFNTSGLLQVTRQVLLETAVAMGSNNVVNSNKNATLQTASNLDVSVQMINSIVSTINSESAYITGNNLLSGINKIVNANISLENTTDLSSTISGILNTAANLGISNSVLSSLGNIINASSNYSHVLSMLSGLSTVLEAVSTYSNDNGLAVVNTKDMNAQTGFGVGSGLNQTNNADLSASISLADQLELNSGFGSFINAFTSFNTSQEQTTSNLVNMLASANESIVQNINSSNTANLQAVSSLVTNNLASLGYGSVIDVNALIQSSNSLQSGQETSLEVSTSYIQSCALASQVIADLTTEAAFDITANLIAQTNAVLLAQSQLSTGVELTITGGHLLEAYGTLTITSTMSTDGIVSSAIEFAPLHEGRNVFVRAQQRNVSVMVQNRNINVI